VDYAKFNVGQSGAAAGKAEIKDVGSWVVVHPRSKQLTLSLTLTLMLVDQIIQFVNLN